MKILFIDKDLEYANAVEEILLQNGFEISLTNDPFEALEILKNNKLPDLIITEVNLVGLDGFKFIKKIKADDRSADIPLVILSEYYRTEDRTAGKILGAVDYISKKESIEEIAYRMGYISAGELEKLAVSAVESSTWCKNSNVSPNNLEEAKLAICHQTYNKYPTLFERDSLGCLKNMSRDYGISYASENTTLAEALGITPMVWLSKLAHKFFPQKSA